jgi:hypothetical protein
MSDNRTLSASANIHSFSISDALVDFVSEQKKILTPDGVSGRSQKNLQVHRLFVNVELGLV